MGEVPAWNLNPTEVLMIAWIRPVSYAVAYEADRGIIMNKENSYEFGLEDETGALQGAFSPCFRWYGTRRIPIHEWTHVAVGYDGVSEVHFMNSELVENTDCGAGGPITSTVDDFRIGHRASSSRFGNSNFVGDIDEAMVYNRVLSEADLGKIYTAQYRNAIVADSVVMQHSHSAGGITDIQASKKVYKGASKKGLSKIPDLIGFWPLSGDAKDMSGASYTRT
jgi:hypothetical protein